MKIANETIAKLTNKELDDLGVVNFGILPLQNCRPKAKMKGYTVESHENIVIFANKDASKAHGLQEQLVKSVDGWVFRIYDTQHKEYFKEFGPTAALQFVL